MSFSPVWQLQEFFPHPSTTEFATVVADWRGRWERLADESETLSATADGWAEFLARWSALLAESDELMAFVGCHAAADAENKTYQHWEGVLLAASPVRTRVTVNVEFGLRGDQSTDPVAELITRDPTLERVRFALDEAARNAAFRLPKSEELLAADLAVDGIQAWSRLYDRVSGSLKIELLENGKLVKKSPGQVHFDSPDRSIRQTNFAAAGTAWQTLADTCADAINHISGFRQSKNRRTGHHHLDLPLRMNRMRRETLDTMWRVVSERKGVLLKYLARKAELLGLKKLTWTDLHAPLPGTPAQSAELSYDAACQLILSTFSQFSPELGQFAETALREGWVEVENRPGKRQGGFCTGFPVRKQSRIFMTFTGTPDSMSTLAHELGHAYHSYVLRNEPFLLQDYPMNLAETASTFCEAVLSAERLRMAQNPAEKRAVLDGMLADAVTFLMNIHARFVFEDRFHQEREAGEVSAERLSQLMHTAQQETYLNGLADDGWYPGFWISKLHFYIHQWPFYNFPYTFGYLLSQGVYALAPKFGDEFPARYRSLLIATGCQQTEAAVSTALGYDLSQPDFWNHSLDVIDRNVAAFLQ